jgi:hypothetical protein
MIKAQNQGHTIKLICGLLLFTLVLSCNKRIEKKLGDSNWRSVERTLEYNEETVVEDVSQFAHYLKFNQDGSFRRTYEFGTWEVEGGALYVTSFDVDCESTFKILKCNSKELILESKKSSGMGFVACSDGNAEDPTITEVYERTE